MRALILVAGAALAVAACSSNESADNTMNVDNLATDNLMVNDTTGLDATTNVRKDRSDDIARLRAELGFHPLEHLSFRLNYQWEQRDSTHDAYDYTDNLVIFQVQFGF